MNLEQAAKALERMASLLNIKQQSNVQKDFQKELELLLAAYWIGRRNSLTANDMRVIVEQAIQNAYLDAINASDTGELSAADQRAINELYANQEEFVTGFVSDARGARGDSEAQAAILARLALWGASIGAVAFVANAINSPDEMVTWRLGRTEEHCSTCARLNGQTHTRDWFHSRGYIPREPGSTSLECGGWNCRCTLD